MISIHDIRLDGGKLCLNFVNTIQDRFEKPQRNYLNNIDDLIDWALKIDIIDFESHHFIKSTVNSELEKTKFFYDRTMDLRELVYSIFREISHNRNVQNDDLMEFNEKIGETFSKLKIEQKNLMFYEDWNDDETTLNKIIFPIIKDAYDLLLQNTPQRIKECPKCGWLFFDSSKNGRRKWCSMATCGSRAKANEWYQRNKDIDL